MFGFRSKKRSRLTWLDPKSADCQSSPEEKSIKDTDLGRKGHSTSDRQARSPIRRRRRIRAVSAPTSRSQAPRRCSRGSSWKTPHARHGSDFHAGTVITDQPGCRSGRWKSARPLPVSRRQLAWSRVQEDQQMVILEIAGFSRMPVSLQIPGRRAQNALVVGKPPPPEAAVPRSRSFRSARSKPPSIRFICVSESFSSRFTPGYRSRKLRQKQGRRRVCAKRAGCRKSQSACNFGTAMAQRCKSCIFLRQKSRVQREENSTPSRDKTTFLVER